MAIPPREDEVAPSWMWRAIRKEGRDGSPYCSNNAAFLRAFRRMWRDLHREEGRHGDPYHSANQDVLEEFRKRWSRPATVTIAIVRPQGLEDG